MSKNWWGIMIALLIVNLIWSMALFLNFSSRNRKADAKADSPLAYVENPTYRLSVAIDDADQYRAAEMRTAINRVCLRYLDGFTTTESVRYAPFMMDSTSERTIIVYTFIKGNDEQLAEIMDAIAKETGITDLTLEKYISCKYAYQN